MIYKIIFLCFILNNIFATEVVDENSILKSLTVQGDKVLIEIDSSNIINSATLVNMLDNRVVEGFKMDNNTFAFSEIESKSKWKLVVPEIVNNNVEEEIKIKN